MPRRNSFIVLIFNGIGAWIRFTIYKFLAGIKLSKPKPLKHFSEGFRQIAYNLLLFVFIFLSLFVLMMYLSLKNKI